MSTDLRKIAIVTGANTGLGFETARALYNMGMHVVVACRSEDKAMDAISRIKAQGDAGELSFGALDLSSLAAVGAFSRQFLAAHDRLDLLINNAGVMVPPEGVTADGYESQFGVNFVAHFALTGHLMDMLATTKDARVVTLSSIGHRGAQIDFANFKLEKPYEQWREYGQSKLADLIFALELDRRLRLKGSTVKSVAAHPGISKTELTRSLDDGDLPAGIAFMSATEGAAPTVFAATNAGVEGGQYFGPDGPEETSGKPAIGVVDPAALDATVNTRLWDWAEKASGLSYP